MKGSSVWLFLTTSLLFSASVRAECPENIKVDKRQFCRGIHKIDEDRTRRFLGKLVLDSDRDDAGNLVITRKDEDAIFCLGGPKALEAVKLDTPWVDWPHYWATGDESTTCDIGDSITRIGEHLLPDGRGVDGALMDLEYQRVELFIFNLFDNYTYKTYVDGDGDTPGFAVDVWPEMRLPADYAHYNDVGGVGEQQCWGDLIRHRTLTGICNDINNPLMGSTGSEFARNVDFENTFPRLTKSELTQARHEDRLSLLKPDPQLISRELFTRPQKPDNGCNQGWGLPDDSKEASCDYDPAPFFNVLAAFWIQFMTHDWFTHLDEGRNAPGLVPVGCDSQKARDTGCRPEDRMEASLYSRTGDPRTIEVDGKTMPSRAYRTTSNNVTAWWDASQIYGYDARSAKRVIRDASDGAKLAQPDGYLPIFEDCDITSPGCVIQPQWRGQEAAAFPDNWNVGLSFYHNLFVREHNAFVDEFRRLQDEMPNEDSGLRHPDRADEVITYTEVTDDEIYGVGRLVVSAMIAKIHTIEWTPQLLYNDPLYEGMNSNWYGLIETARRDRTSTALTRFIPTPTVLGNLARWFAMSDEKDKRVSWYSVFASGAGIFGQGNERKLWFWDRWDLEDPEDVQGGTNHFGSPFNFPEEFASVYRLHPLVPDLIEIRKVDAPNEITLKIPVVKTVRGKATNYMRDRGIENWALSMGRQRLGLLQLQNHPLFLQNLAMSHLGPDAKLDVAALDIIRDRERGIPRFNEFRRQIGLKSLRSYDDFVNVYAPEDRQAKQREVVKKIKEIYGTHRCTGKVISHVQLFRGKPLTDCFGEDVGTEVDNIEDVDNVVGWLAEYTRPHGFAISDTQFQIFIINASRRLLSDRFFTSSFRPEFYSQLGFDWVNNNGPIGECLVPLSEHEAREVCFEPELQNGHRVEVAPLKRVLWRNIPELRVELAHVVNSFDPWARDRGEYYSLEWKARAGAESDPSFSGSE